MQEGETTGLISGQPKPRYVFESSIAWQRKRKVKQFQCCLCAIFLCAVIIALVATVSFTLNEPDNAGPQANETNQTNPNDFLILLLKAPIEDLNTTSVEDDSEKCQDALKFGFTALLSRDQIEQEPSAPVLDKDTPSYRHQKVVATSDKGRLFARSGYAEVHASKKYFHGDNYENRIGNLSKFIKCQARNQTVETSLLFSMGCNSTSMTCNRFHMYRTYNGSCNNLRKPKDFGVAFTAFRRVLPPEYADQISEPRKAKSGQNLPSARTVSVVVHRPYYRDDPKFTVMLAVWGQFLDHDLTATALSQGDGGRPISCCDDHGNFRENLHPECFPVHLDSADPYYKNYNVSCMEFVRSAPAPTCRLGPREQLNQATSFLDGSVIYGTDEETVLSLRTLTNGTLKMFKTPDNRTLLPISENFDDGCNREEEAKNGRYCFSTGDGRANENLHLTSMHLLWARQHNLLAEELQKLNPHWNDEKVFQEARRILIAQMQHITYNEFLPILLGPGLMDKHELTPKEKRYFKGYNESVDPSMANCFVASAFRFAHTLIPTLMKLLANDSKSPEFVQLHKMLFDPFQLYDRGAMDRALRGAMDTKIQASDPYFSPELKEHLFERSLEVDSEAGHLGKSSSEAAFGFGGTGSGRKLCGLDLVSLNIQRGRDHGLPGYTSWRERCGLLRPRSFRELAGHMDDESRHYIESVYSDVDDIDLYTGALSEVPQNDGILGPTITCLILDQFVRVKRGDRFWYENGDQPHSFTKDQLDEIKKTKLSNIICDNSDEVEVAQPYVMRRIAQGNQNTKCSKLDKPDWRQWKEDPKSWSKIGVKNNDGDVSVKVVTVKP